MKHAKNTWILIVSGLLGVAACGGDDGKSDPDVKPDASAVATLDSGMRDAEVVGQDAGTGEDEDTDVPCTSDYPQYSDGMTTTVSGLTVKLVSASPVPPRQLTPNNWVIQLSNADGTPNTDSIVTAADSYMPVHRHHGLTAPTVMATATPGQVQINAINFRMRGPWQVNFTVKPPSGTPVLGTFQVCVQ